ncbi:EF-hand calcium-binding domain-containing protein 11 [Cygnus atratus]|uniref:EF-hand calcium-binding domain-containing protein 11 n=1 Tax=Cygnus atratus TaxID=8868 RepID=UPI0021B84543|nr:EF-hand calcium-binding domain-containing protein 11 [Cygnus atratus]
MRKKPGPSPLEVFEVCDEDNKGCLSRDDFKVAGVLLFGYKPSKVYYLKIFNYTTETRQIFTAFDVQSRGFLTFEDFKKTFNSVSPKLSKRIVPEAFRQVDQDSNGRISFKDFESAMKYGQDEGSPLYFA